MKIGLSALLLISFFLSAGMAQISDSIFVNGDNRSFIFHVPSSVGNPPLVINMHGLGSNASQQRIYTQLDNVADREGFITVYPNGLDNTWDISGNVDVEFISALIDTFISRYSIDANRVYATGFSMGGFMSYRLGCALADKITAIAPVAGFTISYNCNPVRPVPVLHIHGTADSTVKYNNVASTISGWVNRNGCPATAQVTEPYPADNLNSSVRKDHYGPCDGSSDVVLLTYEGLGHVWPGAGYGTSHDISASEELWAFLKNYTMGLPTAISYSFSRNGNKRLSVRYKDKSIYIEQADNIQEIAVFDMQGRIVAKRTFNRIGSQLSLSIPFPFDSPGIYSVVCSFDGGLKTVPLLVQ